MKFGVPGDGRRWIPVGLLALAAALAALGPASADAKQLNRYTIANGCFALKAPSGRFVDSSYAATAAKSGAAKFFLKATGLGTYLFYRSDQTLMDANGEAVGSTGTASRTAEWRVRDAGGPRFTVVNLGEGESLSIGNGGSLRIGGDAAKIEFVKVKGCRPYPEVQVNVTGTPSKGETSFGEVNGTIEGHMHHMAFEFLGGRVHCGRPWHRYGAPAALVDCPDHAVADGNIAVLDNVLDHGTPVGSHSPYGWPKFDGWPTHTSLTHEQSYYRWIERAWRSGLRVYVNLMVENRVLCEHYPFKKNSCNEMNSVRKQIRAAREFEAYVDAQAGGPGKGFYRIVTNPFQARKVINRGKLAVILGMEVSEPFNCYLRNNAPQCSKQDIVDGLDELEDKGLRQFELVNKFDNALTGVAGDGGATGVLTNYGNYYATGSFFRMDRCEDPDNADKDPLAIEHNDDDLAGAVIQAYLPPGAAPVYPDGPKCNQNGLTELGEFAIRELMRRGMIFDPDHMSVLARAQAMALVESKRYSGIISSHSWSTDNTYPRIWKLGGVVTPSAGTSTGFVRKWENLKKDKPKSKFYFGYGYGADQNGFASQGGPRENAAEDPVRYPFRSPLDPAVKVHKQISGERAFDINNDGIAHYGLYPDWIEDLRKVGGKGIVRDLRRGAESYLQSWERAVGIDALNCRRSGRNVSATGVRDIRLGDRPKQLLRRAGQPKRRSQVWTYCGKGKGAKRGKVTATFTRSGHVALIVSNARGASAGGLSRGTRAAKLRRQARSIGGGVYAKQSGAITYLYKLEGGKVRAVGVANPSAGSLRRLANRSRLL